MVVLATWTELAVGVIFAAAAVTALFKLFEATRWLTHAAAKLESFAEVMPQLTAIGHEFKKNNGQSLRDAIDRIEKRSIAAEQLAAEVKKITEEIKATCRERQCDKKETST